MLAVCRIENGGDEAAVAWYVTNIIGRTGVGPGCSLCVCKNVGADQLLLEIA